MIFTKVIFIFTVNSLRKRWKYLRDQFSVELGKIPQSRSGDAASEYTSKWPYFKSLLFLKTTVKARMPKGNLSVIVNNNMLRTERSPGCDDQNFDEETQEMFSEASEDLLSEVQAPIDKTLQSLSETPSSSPSPPVPVHLKPKRKRSQADSWNAAIIDIEKQKLQYLKEKSENKTDNDEDLLFFKSLLPHVRNIPQERKLAFRSQVQELVDQFAYQQISRRITQYSSLSPSNSYLIQPVNPTPLSSPNISDTDATNFQSSSYSY